MVMVGNGERGELREKESKRKRKIRMGKCWLVRDTSEYASPFVTGKLFCLNCCCWGICTEMYTGQAKTLGHLSFVYLSVEKLICQINRSE